MYRLQVGMLVQIVAGKSNKSLFKGGPHAAIVVGINDDDTVNVQAFHNSTTSPHFLANVPHKDDLAAGDKVSIYYVALESGIEGIDGENEE